MRGKHAKGKPKKAPSSAPPPTCRPSRRKASRWMAAPISSRSARCFITFILKSCRNRAGNVELLGVAEGQLRDEEDLLEVETRCDHLLAEGGEIVLVSAADFLE